MRTSNTVIMLTLNIVFSLFGLSSPLIHLLIIYVFPSFQTPLYSASHTDPQCLPYFYFLAVPLSWDSLQQIDNIHECGHVVRNEEGRTKRGYGC